MYHTWILWDIEASIPHLFRLLPTWRNMEVRMATRKRCVMASPRMLKQPCLNARGWTKNCSETWGETSRTRGWNMKNIYILYIGFEWFWLVLKGEEGFDPTKMSWWGHFFRKFSGFLSFKHIDSNHWLFLYIFLWITEKRWLHSSSPKRGVE